MDKPQGIVNSFKKYASTSMKLKQNRHSKPFSLALMMKDVRVVSQMTSHSSPMGLFFLVQILL